jgi:hypothetical protein
LNAAGHLLKTLFLMADFVEARDAYTGGHLWRVSRYALLLAQSLRLDNATCARVALGGFLHDIGKIGIPDAILNKPGKLTDEEYEIIKTHPRISARLLENHVLVDLVRDAVVLHHEQPNGRGYPYALRGDAIPPAARIVGLCDAFDAMTSTRPYRRGMPVEQALGIIDANRGEQFDAAYAAEFIALGRSGLLDHIVGHSDAGIPLQQCPACGPTIVVRRANKSGDLLYCRSCGGEARLERTAGEMRTHSTGQRGAPADREPAVDHPLIDELVAQAAARLATELSIL